MPFVDQKRKEREERLRKRRLELKAERGVEEEKQREEKTSRQLLTQAQTFARKRGRPKGVAPVPAHLENARNKARKVVAWRKKSGQGKLELGAEEMKTVAAKLEEKAKASVGTSATKFWQDTEEELGLPRHLVMRWTTPKRQAALEKWKQKRSEDTSVVVPKPGRKRTWKRFESQDQGIRLGKDGQKKKTKPDPWQHYWPPLKRWCREENRAGRDLAAEDILDEFLDKVEEEAYEIALIQEKKRVRGRRSGRRRRSRPSGGRRGRCCRRGSIWRARRRRQPLLPPAGEVES